jgi:hypothetical protein
VSSNDNIIYYVFCNALLWHSVVKASHAQPLTVAKVVKRHILDCPTAQVAGSTARWICIPHFASVHYQPAAEIQGEIYGTEEEVEMHNSLGQVQNIAVTVPRILGQFD